MTGRFNVTYRLELKNTKLSVGLIVTSGLSRLSNEASLTKKSRYANSKLSLSNSLEIDCFHGL